MLYLIGSIILTSWLTISFKYVAKFRINTFQAIVFNYLTCVITGSIVNGEIPFNQTTLGEPWFFWALGMGTIFILLFNVIAQTTQRIGLAVASVANKLSLVIPYVFSIYLYEEKSSWVQVGGIALALAAVFLTCYPSGTESKKGPGRVGILLMLLPVILFFGSGLLDSMIKYVETVFLNPQNQDQYLTTAFGSAAAIGLITVAIQVLSGEQNLSLKAAAAGICIGVPNYFSIWCLIHALNQFPGESAMIIPVNNMGIVLFSSVIAALVFSERLTLINWFGIGLSLFAIALIAFG